jgi:hypothetical protein
VFDGSAALMELRSWVIIRVICGLAFVWFGEVRCRGFLGVVDVVALVIVLLGVAFRRGA